MRREGNRVNFNNAHGARKSKSNRIRVEDLTSNEDAAMTAAWTVVQAWAPALAVTEYSKVRLVAAQRVTHVRPRLLRLT